MISLLGLSGVVTSVYGSAIVSVISDIPVSIVRPVATNVNSSGDRRIFTIFSLSDMESYSSAYVLG